jgi:hypothetical protein
MMWHLTFLALDLCCLFALVTLLKDAPDFLQKSVLGWLICGFMVLAAARIGALLGTEGSENMVAFGRTCTHLGAVVYILRLFIAEQSRRCLPTSYKPSSN